jgi:CheY-like chemotaxis protein
VSYRQGTDLKILICCESEIVLQMAGMALEGAGHQVVLDRDPLALVPQVSGAAALLVDAARAKQAVALLRDRGFTGRALLVGAATPEELKKASADFPVEGVVPFEPPDEIPRRLQAALEGRRKVLIVDDSEIVAQLLKAELEAKGFEIQYAPDAEKATSIILKRQTRPDLILLDINMPKVDGAQFCRFVKKNEMFKSIKVLFCSGEARERIARLVEECGADGYILKDEFLGKWIVDNAG